MKISTKLGGGYLLVLAMLVICGASGLYGVNRLSALLDELTGPVWDTADGAMEGSIGVEAEMLAVGMIVSGRGDRAEAEALLNEGQAMADEALGRMINAGLLSADETARVSEQKNAFRQAEAHLLHAHGQFSAANKTLNDGFDSFQTLMVSIEELGDQAVESLEGDPDQLTSWNSGLAEKWSAADGGMETQIALLQRFYYLQRLINANESAGLLGKLEESLQSLREKSTEVREHPLFQQKIASGPQAGKSYAQALSSSVDQHEREFEIAVKALAEMKKARSHYDKLAATFLETIEATEEVADGKLEGQAEYIAATQNLTLTLTALAMLIGVVVALAVIYFVVREIIHAIEGMSFASQKIADGDLSINMCRPGAKASNDELLTLSRNMQRMTEGLRETISQVSGTSAMLASQAEELSLIAGETRGGVLDQQQRTGAVASAITELTASSREVADNTAAAKLSADQARGLSAQGQQVVEATLSSMQALNAEVARTAEVVNQLSEDSQQIGTVLDVIRSIAEQTNLLALNAAIEAARAGEQGRGFAVVADEVRSLAQRTQESTEEIQRVVEGLQARAGGARQSMEQSRAQTASCTEDAASAGGALAQITEEVQRIAEQNAHIAAAMSQQEVATEEISQSVVEIENRAGQTVSAVNQTSESSQELARQASNLQALVQRFKLA